MKTRALVTVLTMAISGAAFAQTPKPTEPISPTLAAKDKIPAPKKEPAKKPQPKEEEIGTIEGMTIPRGSGFLGLSIVGGTFKLSFYDAKKKPMEPDVSRAALRWDPKYKLGIERVVLNPSGDGKSLTASKMIRPPYAFKLFMTLLTDGAEDGTGETFVVDFRG